MSPTISASTGSTCVTVAAPTVGESTHTLPSPTRTAGSAPSAAGTGSGDPTTLPVDGSISTSECNGIAAGVSSAPPSPPRPRRRRQRLPQRRRSRRARRRAPRRAHDARGGGRKVVDHPPSQRSPTRCRAPPRTARPRASRSPSRPRRRTTSLPRADDRSGGASGSRCAYSVATSVSRRNGGSPVRHSVQDGRANRCRLAHPPGRPDLLGGHVVDCSGELAGLDPGSDLGLPNEAEVRQVGMVMSVQEHVARFHVAVDDASFVAAPRASATWRRSGRRDRVSAIPRVRSASRDRCPRCTASRGTADRRLPPRRRSGPRSRARSRPRHPSRAGSAPGTGSPASWGARILSATLRRGASCAAR